MGFGSLSLSMGLSSPAVSSGGAEPLFDKTPITTSDFTAGTVTITGGVGQASSDAAGVLMISNSTFGAAIIAAISAGGVHRVEVHISNYVEGNVRAQLRNSGATGLVTLTDEGAGVYAGDVTSGSNATASNALRLQNSLTATYDITRVVIWPAA